MKKYKFGFTLVELLAVVLIIAILTAIAVPQYRKSIRRAEAIEAMVNVRALFDSAKRYKAANSTAPMKLKGLDVEFFDASSADSDIFDLGNFMYIFSSTSVGACRKNHSGYCLKFYYKHSTYGKDAFLCERDPNGDAKANRLADSICESLGNKDGSVFVIE